MSEVVCFSYAKDILPADTRLPDRPQLFAKLQDYDLNPVVSLGAENAFTEDGVATYAVSSGQSRRTPLAELGVLVNRVDRSLKKPLIPLAEQLPAMINENETRSLVWHKERVSAEVLEPLANGIATALIGSSEDIDSFLAEQTAQNFIIKSRNGSLGKDVQTVARGSVTAVFAKDSNLYDQRVLQPAYDFTAPFPSSVQSYDQASRPAFDGWNVAGKVKELRMYGFYTPQRVAAFPAARVIEDGDQWFFVDPDSLPPELASQTERAISKAAALSGATALYGTVDYGYGSLDGGDPNWQAIEMNGLAPYMIGYDKHAGVADRLRTLFANQISLTAQPDKQYGNS